MRQLYAFVLVSLVLTGAVVTHVAYHLQRGLYGTLFGKEVRR